MQSYIKPVKLLKKEVNNINFIYFFLLLYISIKLAPFGNNVNNIFLKWVLNLIRKVEIAGVNTAKLPVLSNKEKQELLVKIKNGDNEAREKFIQGNLRLVLSVIQWFTRKRRKYGWPFSNRMCRFDKSDR